MRISEAAELVGVPTHVLRHWEDEGVLRPDRSATNHREYSAQQVAQARIVYRLRASGVSLAVIRTLGPSTPGRRRDLLAVEARRLDELVAQAARAAEFLRHTGECRHPVIESCAQCSEYAAPEAG